MKRLVLFPALLCLLSLGSAPAPAEAGEQAGAAAHGSSGSAPWWRHLSLEFGLGIPMYDREIGADTSFHLGQQTSFDFNIGIAFPLSSRVSLGLQISPGFVASQAPSTEHRGRFSTTAFVRVFASRNVYLRTGAFVALYPFANIGVHPGIGVVLGKSVKFFIEASTPTTFVGNRAEVEITLDVGIEFHPFSTH